MLAFARRLGVPAAAVLVVGTVETGEGLTESELEPVFHETGRKIVARLERNQ